MAKEVVRPRVLIQPPHQVADSMDEVFAAGRRRIEQQVVDNLGERAALVVRHALEHLELDPVEHTPLLGQDQAIGHIEQVVGGDPEMHGGDVLCPQPLLEHALEVGVRLALGLERGLGPAMQGRVDPLHLHVGALDEPDGDRCAPRLHPRPGPGSDLVLNGVGVGKIGLQGDPGARALKSRPGQGTHEGLGREAHVPVLLHVQVDELRHLRPVGTAKAHPRRLAIEGLQAVTQTLDRVLPGQGPDLGVDGRDLDRETLHIRTPKHLAVGLDALGDGPLTQQGLTQEVEVHPQPRLMARLEVGQQVLVLRGQDHVGGLLPQFLLNHRHRHPGEIAAKRPKALEQGLVQGREEARDPLNVEDMDQLFGRPRGASRAQGLIGDLDQGRLVVGTFHDALELILLAALLGRLQLAGPLLQDPGEIHRPLERLRELRCRVRPEAPEQGAKPGGSRIPGSIGGR